MSWQKCPLCSGDGTRFYGLTQAQQECRTCQGSGMVHEVTGSPGPRPTQPPFQAQPPFNPQGESAAQAAVKNQQEEAVKAALDKLNQGPKVTGSPHWKPSMGTGCLR